MPHDPDFHETAAAWLDGTGEDGAHRVLREILRDSPDSAMEFAVLARAEAALQLAAFTPAERLQRARRLIQPSAASKLRRLIARPAFRVVAAAVLVIGGVWWIMSHGEESGTPTVKPRLAPQVQRTETPVLTRTTTPPEKLPPADKEFARRMSRFIVPEFKATGRPLAAALKILRENIAAIDETAVPEFSAAPELPDDRTVHLHLRYLPVAVLVDLIAIQTGTKFQPSGKSYCIAADAKAPMPGGLHKTSFAMLPFGVGRRNDISETLDDYATHALEQCLGEKAVMSIYPNAKPGDGFSYHVLPSERLYQMLRRLNSAGSGTPPGTMVWSAKAVEITGTENPAKFAELARESPGRTFTDPEFQMLMRDVAQMKGVDLITWPLLFTQPGESTSSFAGQSGPDPLKEPDGSTGIRWTIENQPAGEGGGAVEWLIETAATDPSKPDNPPLRSISRGSGRFLESYTFMAHREKSAEGNLRVFFITVNAAPPQEDLPYGIPVVGRSGFVYSPYVEGTSQLVDVTGLKRGSKIRCPFTNRDFRVP